jgi:hypothetical protein
MDASQENASYVAFVDFAVVSNAGSMPICAGVRDLETDQAGTQISGNKMAKAVDPDLESQF